MAISKIDKYIGQHEQEMVDFLVSLIQAKPVNPYFVPDQGVSEAQAQKIIKNKLTELGLEVWEVPVDFEQLKKYKGLPGYMPGITDTISFQDRPNIVACLRGTDSQDAPSVLLSGHVDVVPVDDEDLWEYPPFAGVIHDGKVHGRGATDMLGGLGGMVSALEAIVQTGQKPRGDIWFASIVSEEFGGTGALAVADWMQRNGIAPDVAIMGESTKAEEVCLVCRAIAFADIVVTGRAGHLERTPEHWTDGGAVDAIAKARYIMDQIDNLNAEWALRKDKDHPYINDPCQVKVSKIKGGHHPSSYAESCTISLDIQSLPHEQDADGIPSSVRMEVEDFLLRVCNADSWLRENPVEVIWELDADCVEISDDHAFVRLLAEHTEMVNGGGRLTGQPAHYDGGWFDRLNGTKVVCFGPGESKYAHARNEICEIKRLIEYIRIVAAVCLEWCK